MSYEKYRVPEGMLKAALRQVDYVRAYSGVEEGIIKRALQDAVEWIINNPVVPTEKEAKELSDEWYRIAPMKGNQDHAFWLWAFNKIQSRVFVEQEHKDGTVFWKEGTTIPLGIWSNGKLYQTNAVTCCERDTDGDGNCDIHSSPGVLRKNNKPDISQWICRLGGYTFSRKEANAIIEYINTAVHEGKQ